MKNHLRELRTAKGWTQEDLAQRVGVSRQAIIAVEADKHDPSLDLAYRIAAQFDQPVDTIFANPHVRRRR